MAMAAMAAKDAEIKRLAEEAEARLLEMQEILVREMEEKNQ